MASLEDLSVDQLIARARQTEVSDQLLGRLVNDPSTREQTLRALKKINPALPIPEIDARDAVMADVGKTDKRVEALEAKLQESEIRERIRQNREEIKSKHKLSEDDIAAVEAIMVDKDAPIPNYEAAVKVYKASRQAAIPSSGSLSSPVFEMPPFDTWKNGINNPAQLDKIAMGEAFKAMEEVRANTGS